MFTKIVAFVLVLGVFAFAFAQTGSRMQPNQNLPAGYWPPEKSQPIIDKTQTIRLAPDLSQLSVGEKKVVAKLLEVGKIFQSIYEDQRHIQALSSYRDLVALDKRTGSTAATQNLLTLYRLNQGPIATTLDNKREPFCPVGAGKEHVPVGSEERRAGGFPRQTSRTAREVHGFTYASASGDTEEPARR